jgi:hypothetical protein
LKQFFQINKAGGKAMSERVLRLYVGLYEKAKMEKEYGFFECSPPSALTTSIRVCERKIDSHILSNLEFFSLNIDAYTCNTNYYGAKIFKNQLMKFYKSLDGEEVFIADIQELDESTESMIVISDSYWLLPERFTNLTFID